MRNLVIDFGNERTARIDVVDGALVVLGRVDAQRKRRLVSEFVFELVRVEFVFLMEGKLFRLDLRAQVVALQQV